MWLYEHYAADLIHERFLEYNVGTRRAPLMDQGKDALLLQCRAYVYDYVK